MKLKPKAARRLILLSAAVVVLLIAVGMLFGVRSWQKERRTANLRDAGMAAAAEADHIRTLENLGRYLRRKPDDREAWLAYAGAREAVEEPAAQHLLQAVGAYQRAWFLDETDRKTGLKLLQLLNRVSYFTEAKDLAVKLRPADLKSAGPEHAEVLREEAGARIALRSFDQTGDDLTTKLVELEPDRYASNYLRVSYLLGADRRDDAVAFARALKARRPGDSRFEFLEMVVRVTAGEDPDAPEFVASLCRLAGLRVDPPVRAEQPDYAETEVVAQLISAFDRLGLHVHALLVLQDADTRLNDPDARRLYARRAWQLGFPSDVLAMFQDGRTAPDQAHSDVLAFKTLSELDLARRDQAAATLALLRSRDSDFAARAWSKALTALVETKPAREALSLIDAASKEHPREPTFSVFRAEALWRLGRGDEARQAWESAAQIGAGDGWATPSVRLAESLLDEGRLDEGLRAARQALDQFRTSIAANVLMLRAQAAMVESGRLPDNPAGALREIDDIQSRIAASGESAFADQVGRIVLPMRIMLLAATDRRAEAVALVEGEISKPGPIDPGLARRLAEASARSDLGTAIRVIETARRGEHAEDAGLLLTHALLLDGEGNRDQAVALVDAAVREAKPERAREITLARAQYLEATGSPDAPRAWKDAAEKHPDALDVQIAALRAPSTSADAAFVDALAARVIQLGGSDPDRESVDLRFARSRALLHGTPNQRARSQAVAILRGLVLDAPSRLDIRGVLIDALLLDDPAREIQPDLQGAADQLTAAAAVAPDRGPYTLRLAEVLTRLGRNAEAVAELNKLALDTTADRTNRLRAVDRLASMREIEPALRGVELLIGREGSPTPDLLIRRAEYLFTLRRDREATQAYRAVLESPATDPRLIVAVASGLRTIGDQDGVRIALDKLAKAEVPADERALAMAQYWASSGDADRAVAEHRRATELAPKNPAAWAALARYLLGRGDVAGAEAAARQGLANVPDDPQLLIVVQQTRVANQDESAADLEQLAAALERDPATARRAAAVRAVDRALKEGRLDDASALVRLAEQFADDPSTQVFVSRRLMLLTPPRAAEAARVMRRAMIPFATNPEVQQEATRAFAMAGDFESMLTAATAWRAITRDEAADLAVAEAYLGLNRPQLAVEAVRRTQLPPTIAPTDVVPLGVLNVRTRAAMMQRDVASAMQAVRPYVQPSPVVRSRIALPVAAALTPTPADARTWIDMVAAASDPKSAQEQLALAEAWGLVSNRFADHQEEFLRKGVAVTDSMLSDPAMSTAAAFEVRSRLLESLGDAPGAVAAAREALARSSESPGAHLALAALLLRTGGDRAEAVRLCESARQLDPKSPQPLLVLAQTHLAEAAAASSDAARAASASKAAQAISALEALSPREPAVIADAAMLAEQANDMAAAVRLYERLLSSADAPSGFPLAVVKNNLAYGLLVLSESSEDKSGLRRARSLVEEAIGIAQVSEFHDTLGAVSTAMGDRAQAITAFRRALELDPSAIPPKAALAGLLATGSEPERAEAASLIQAVADHLGSGGKLSDRRMRVYEQARRSLGS